MRFSDLLFMAVRSLKSNLLETVMQICATALGVALFASSLSLIRSYTRDIEEVSQDLRFRTITVSAQARSSPSAPDTPIRLTRPEVALSLEFPLSLLANAKAECPDVGYAWVEENWSMAFGGGGSGLKTWAAYSTPKVAGDYFDAHQLRLKKGAGFASTDYVPGSQVAILGAHVARRLFPSSDAVGASLPYPLSGRVIGVLEEHFDRFPVIGGIGGIDEAIIAPLSLEASTRFAFSFTAKSPSRMDSAVAQLQSFFDTTYGKEVVAVQYERDWIQGEKRMSLPLLSLIAFMAGAVLFVIITNILTLQLGSVGRRTRQIGLASSVGASRRDLFAQYVAEFSLIGTIGGVLGIIAALGLTSLLQGLVNPAGIALPGVQLAASPLLLALAAVVVATVNSLFALLPAAQAIRTKPAAAMRYE